MNLQFLNIIILLGALQGLIISVLLFFSRGDHSYANRLLGCFILMLALACLNLYAQVTDLYETVTVIRWVIELVPLLAAMAFGPLLYYYTRAVVDPSFRMEKRDRLHFVPVIIDLVPHMIVWVFVIGVYSGLFTQEFRIR